MAEGVGRPWGCCEHCLAQLLAGWLAPAGSAPVWLDFTLLADVARVEAGNLLIEGAGLASIEAHRYPFSPSHVLAGRLSANSAMVGLPLHLELHLIDEEGVLEDWSIDAFDPWPAAESPEADVLRRPIALDLAPRLAIQHSGRHALLVLCDGIAVASLPLLVETRRTLLANVGDDRPRARND